jgi:hypothetical protein
MWVRIQFLFMYLELHKYVKSIACMATIVQLHPKLKQEVMPFLSLFSTVAAVHICLVSIIPFNLAAVVVDCVYKRMLCSQLRHYATNR